jgi:hypothetical protein
MCVRKMGRAGGWTRIRDGIRRRKRPGCQVEGSAVFGGKSELA